MIKTIIFDLGGVVIHIHFKEIYFNFGRRIGLSEDFIKKYHDDNINNYFLGKKTLEKFWQDMRDVGTDPNLDLKAIWIDEGVKNREINNEMLEIIGKLRKKYSVGVLTNLTELRFLLDEQANLYSNFDYALLSFKEHLKKPDPAFYKLALERASVKPEEALYIDDREEHIVGAEAVGINSILYDYPNNVKLLKDMEKFGILL